MKTDPSIDRLRARETQQRLCLMRIKAVVVRATVYNTKLNDKEVPPTGDDYNTLLGLVDLIGSICNDAEGQS